jgi:hypothetical protein
MTLLLYLIFIILISPVIFPQVMPWVVEGFIPWIIKTVLRPWTRLEKIESTYYIVHFPNGVKLTNLHKHNVKSLWLNLKTGKWHESKYDPYVVLANEKILENNRKELVAAALDNIKELTHKNPSPPKSGVYR